VRSSFVIDSFPARAALYRATHAIVAVDVFRASTTIVTALASGRRVYVTSSVGEALRIASSLPGAWLAGEQAGVQPEGFDLQNSPSAVERLPDRRPLVLVSSAGVLLLAMAAGAPAVYVACLRNLTATARRLAGRHRRVAVIGAGNRGEARAEDQMACAWLGRLLLAAGFGPEDERTATEVERWTDIDPMTLLAGPSAEYLRSTGQEEDIGFVLSHLDDVPTAAEYDGLEVRPVGEAQSGTAQPPGEAA
jgi:2-phosphosulfolactate phosphatase